MSDRRLTAQEKRIVDLAGEGLTNDAIARRMGVTESTVKTHMDRIMIKYDAHSRTQVVSLVLRAESDLIIAALANRISELERTRRSGAYRRWPQL